MKVKVPRRVPNTFPSVLFCFWLGNKELESANEVFLLRLSIGCFGDLANSVRRKACMYTFISFPSVRSSLGEDCKIMNIERERVLLVIIFIHIIPTTYPPI